MRDRRLARAARSKSGRGALLAGAVLAVCVGAGGAGAATHTQASIYAPFTATGQPAVHVTHTVHGFCFTGSIAVSHKDAWRCLTGNLLYDPCFSSAQAKGIVLCPATGPWSSSAIKIKLTQRLPAKLGNSGQPSISGVPWALVTTSGWRCRLLTGATSLLHGKRLNYFCTGTRDGLWGAPARRSQPWRIFAAPFSATQLRRKVSIRSAWF